MCFIFLFSFQAFTAEVPCKNHFLKLYIDTHREEFSGFEKVVVNVFYPQIKYKINKRLLTLCKSESCSMKDLSELQIQKIVADTVEETLSTSNKFKAYSAIFSIMVSTAFLNMLVTDNMPSEVKFLGHFISQVTVLGIYVFGSPVWDPLASQFRKWAFGARNRGGRVERIEHSELNEAKKRLEEMWYETQSQYSLNAQMSRNIMESYISMMQPNLFEATRFFREEMFEDAASNIAMTIVRLRTRYPDIPHLSPFLKTEFDAQFLNLLNDVDDWENFKTTVWLHVIKLDVDAVKSELRYKEIIDYWFMRT